MKEQSLSHASEKPEWLAHIEAILEMLNEGNVIANEDQRILFVNSRLVEMTGIPQQEMLGADVSEFYSEQEWEFLAHQIAVVRHQGRHRYEFLLPQKNGGRLPVSLVAATVLSYFSLAAWFWARFRMLRPRRIVLRSNLSRTTALSCTPTG